MTNFIENDFVSGIYRTTDPIQNFRIRVKLERVTSNTLLPSLLKLRIQNDLLTILDQTDGENERDKKKTKKKLKQDKDNNIEEFVIAWQEKIFNRIEFQDYGHDPGPNGEPRERRYFEKIRTMKANGQNPGRIYTYVEGDPSHHLEPSDSYLTDSPKEDPNRLTVGLTQMRRRRGFSSKNPINNRPTVEDLRVSRYSILPYQTMYIMADLSDRHDQAAAQLTLLPQPLNECLLCKIQYFTNGTLIIRPDFNTNRNGYMVETGTFYNEIYQYHLDFASIQIRVEDFLKEKRILDEILRRQQNRLVQVLGKKFECPPNGILKLNLFGELISAKNFEYDDLYIHYQLDLPDNWYVDQSAILSGYTPTSRTTSASRYDDIVYFSIPFEFEVWYRPPLMKDENDCMIMPKMYFHVASQDSWGRHRTEGYTYLDVPTYSGCYDEHLCCWRPYENSMFDELRRYFIGSSAELDDLSAIAIPHMYRHEKKRTPFSRFGFRTISTGEVHLRLHVVFQSENIAMAYQKRRRIPGADPAEHDEWVLNVRGVLGKVLIKSSDDRDDEFVLRVPLDQYEQAKRRAAEVSQTTVEPIVDSRSTLF